MSKLKQKKYKGLNQSEIRKYVSCEPDPAIYYDKEFKEDKIGKYYYDYKDSIKTIRNFKSYKVASIANSARSPDLTGYFLKV